MLRMICVWIPLSCRKSAMMRFLVKVVSDSICMSTYKCAILGTEHKRVHPDVAEHPAIMGLSLRAISSKVG